MRKKPGMQSNGGSFSNNKRRMGGGGSNGGGSSNNHNNHNRPRKNYGAAREKYLSQARDALAAGDRVLAENYFQHAEHCYRMMMEEGHHRHHQQQQQQAEAAAVPHNDNNNDIQDDTVENTTQLPAFITAAYAQPAVAVAEQPVAQEWEE
jgi:hypothetical protein